MPFIFELISNEVLKSSEISALFLKKYKDHLQVQMQNTTVTLFAHTAAALFGVLKVGSQCKLEKNTLDKFDKFTVPVNSEHLRQHSSK